MRKSYSFIVDTDTYAGNFERDMTAYVTGMIGECGVGDNYATMFAEECPDLNFADAHIEMRPDDNGCHRPTSIFATPGWFNDGLGSHWPVGTDPDLVRSTYLATVKKNGYEDKNEPGCFPAYQSVAMYLQGEVSEDWLQFMMARAKKFVEVYRETRWGSDVKISGFRVIVEKTVTATVWDSAR